MQSRKNMPVKSFTLIYIIKGIIFCIIVFPLGYFLYLALKIGMFEAFSYIVTHVKNKPILGILLILVVIFGAFISVVFTSIEYGLPLHKYIRGKKKKED